MSDMTRRGLLIGTAAMPFLASQVLGGEIAKQEMPEKGVALVATVKAKADEVEAVKEALLALVEPTRKEEGCLAYNLHQSQADKTQFMFYEQWASKEALDAHSQSPHFKALGPQIKDKTEKGGGVTFYELLQPKK